ncbi:MAG: starch-binding protein [Ruminococcus sp.]
MKTRNRFISVLLVAVLMIATVVTCLTVFAAGDTVYVKVNSNYGTPNCYMWNGSGGAGNENAGWPGVQMTAVGNGVYSYTPDVSYTNVIFNNGSSKTDDLTYPGGSSIYDMSADSWSTYDPSAVVPTEPGTDPSPTQSDNPNTDNPPAPSGTSLGGYFSTNPNGQVGKNTTITIDGNISDWDSSMLIAQGVANDDPRVYRPNSMYEIPIDLYALYGAYDDNNIYLMWEMTNVQDIVAPNDDYPLSQGILWQTQNLPIFIAVDTGKADSAIGNNGALIGGGTIWNSGMTFGNSFNRLIALSTNGSHGPWVYAGNSSGLNPKEILDGSTSKISLNYGKGILSTEINGINGGYGYYNNRVPGDIVDSSADWVNFKEMGHKSNDMDFFYEVSIPYSALGITKSDVENNGIGIMLVTTLGKSAMDCLPADLAMTDNAQLDDSGNSQENNSREKSDEDFITVPFARIGKLYSGGTTPTPTTPDVEPTTIAQEPSSPAQEPTTTVQEPTSLAPIPTESGTNKVYYLGDADLNGTVNVKDATLVQKVVANIEIFATDEEVICADADKNTQVNVKDATAIQKWVANIAVDTPIGEAFYI